MQWALEVLFSTAHTIQIRVCSRGLVCSPQQPKKIAGNPLRKMPTMGFSFFFNGLYNVADSLNCGGVAATTRKSQKKSLKWSVGSRGANWRDLLDFSVEDVITRGHVTSCHERNEF